VQHCDCLIALRTDCVALALLHALALQAQKEFPADFANCKDKFLVQTTVLPPGQVGRP
jgi:hypothetical protein